MTQNVCGSYDQVLQGSTSQASVRKVEATTAKDF